MEDLAKLLFRDKNSEAAVAASGTLRCIAASKRGALDAHVPLLVALLSSGSASVAEQSAVVLLRMLSTGTDAVRRAVDAEGCLPKLVALLPDVSEDLAWESVQRLSAPTGCSDPLPLLSALLSSHSAAVVESAASELHELARQGLRQQRTVAEGCLPVLVTLLSRMAMGEAAAGVAVIRLASHLLAANDGVVCRAAVAAGAMPQLAAVVARAPGSLTTAPAANALLKLWVDSATYRSMITTAGYLPALAPQLSCVPEAVAIRMVLTLRNIIVARTGPRPIPVDARYMPLLVALLQHDSEPVVEMASTELKNVVTAGESVLCSALLAAGCLPPLMALQ